MENNFEGLDAFLNDLERNASIDEKKRSIALGSGITRNNELKVLLFPNKENKFYDDKSVTEHEVWFTYFSKKKNAEASFSMQFLDKDAYGELNESESALYDEVLQLFKDWSTSGRNRNSKGYSTTSTRPMVAINAYLISDSKGTEPNYYTLYFRNPKSFKEGLNTFFAKKAGELGIDDECKEGGVLSIRKCLQNEDFGKMFMGTFNSLVKGRPGLLIMNQVNQTTNYTFNLTYSPNTKSIESVLGKNYDLTEAKEYFLNHSAAETYIGNNTDEGTGKLFNKAYFERLRDNLRNCLKPELEAKKAEKIDFKNIDNNSQDLLDQAIKANEVASETDDKIPF